MPPLNKAAATLPAERFCPRCFRPEAERAECAHFAVGCPDPVEADPARVITVSCGPCAKVRHIPLNEIMKGKLSLKELGSCVSDVCRATLVPPAHLEAAKPKGPSPLSSAGPPSRDA